MANKKFLVDFYNQKHLAEISKRGYYSEKTNFFLAKLKQLSSKEKLNILDIACNDGHLSLLYSRFGKVTGVELNKQAVIACQKKGLDCLNMDIMDLPTSFNDQFNVVIAGDIIEHIFDTDAFLKKIYTLLKPGGSLLLTTPNVSSLARRLLLVLGINPFLEFSTQLPYPEFNVGHIRYYTARNVLDQLRLIGFEDIVIYGDKINLTPFLTIPYKLAKFIPTLSRNLMIYCRRPS